MKESGIFFVRNEQGMTRIARTSDLAKRMSDWQAASPSPLRVIGKITTAMSRALVTSYIRQRVDARTRTKTRTPYEKDPSGATVLAELHRHFVSHRVHGDWYMLEEAQLLELHIEHARSAEELADLVDQAETLWRAIEHARAQHPKGEQFWAEDIWGHSWEDTMRSHLIAWLVKHGRHDLSVVLRFRQEFQFVEWLVVRARNSYDMPIGLMTEEYVCWLMMHGASIFKTFLPDPLMLSLKPEVDHWDNHADRVLSELTKGTPLEGECLLDRFDQLIMSGARIEDFSGWNVARAVAEFGG